LEASVWLEVSGLPLGTSEDAVKSIFTKFGYIEEFSFNRGKAEIKFNEPSVATSLCDSGTVVTLSGKNLKLGTLIVDTIAHTHLEVVTCMHLRCKSNYIWFLHSFVWGLFVQVLTGNFCQTTATIEIPDAPTKCEFHLYY
jgi:hypothetical protein